MCTKRHIFFMQHYIHKYKENETAISICLFRNSPGYNFSFSFYSYWHFTGFSKWIFYFLGKQTIFSLILTILSYAYALRNVLETYYVLCLWEMEWAYSQWVDDQAATCSKLEASVNNVPFSISSYWTECNKVVLLRSLYLSNVVIMYLLM